MSIFNQLLMVEDPRINRCKKFPLGYILTTVFTATLSGCSSWYEIEDYAEEYKDDLEALYERISGKSSSWGTTRRWDYYTRSQPTMDVSLPSLRP